MTGRRRRRLDLGQARQLYETGLSFSQVGREAGYSATYLARCFKVADIPARPAGRPLTTPAPVIDLEEVVELHEQGSSFPRPGERYGLSADAVRTRYLRAKGLPVRGTEADWRGVPLPPEVG